VGEALKYSVETPDLKVEKTVDHSPAGLSETRRKLYE
jgi:hypothetical protein